MHVRHESERVRADEHSGHDESGEGGNLEAVECEDHDHGDREDDCEVLQDEELLHPCRPPFEL